MSGRMLSLECRHCPPRALGKLAGKSWTLRRPLNTTLTHQLRYQLVGCLTTGSKSSDALTQADTVPQIVGRRAAVAAPRKLVQLIIVLRPNYVTFASDFARGS